MKRYYSADRDKLLLIKSAITRTLVIMVIDILIGLVGVYLLATLDDIDAIIRMDDYEMQQFIGVLCLLDGLSSLIFIFDILIKQRKYNNMLRSYIQLDDDILHGISFIDECEATGGTFFSVPYSSIRNIVAHGDGRALNLTVYTDQGAYNCLEIENPYSVADEINRLIENKIQADKRREEKIKVEAAEDGKYCRVCGGKLLPHARFCSSCGTKR